MPENTLKLFVAGSTARSRLAIQNLEQVRGRLSDYAVVVIDVIADPESAERDQILATPPLVVCDPEPSRRVVGDLSDLPGVFRALDLEEPT